MMIHDFKKFILRGNTVDLAVAVVVGAAFGTIVKALVTDIITPLIAAIGGQPDFSKLSFTLNNSKFLYGDFLNAVIGFLIIAAVVFFLIIQPINKLTARAARNKTTPEPNTRKCPECFSEIQKAATRCAFCTSKVTALSKS
jgi:large conductance mechanosensitive channel